MVIRESPETTTENFFFYKAMAFKFLINFFKRSFFSNSKSLTREYSRFRRLQEKPMFIAVSILSPVRIQTLIPAFKKSRIHSGTLSCSLSSIAVAPMMVRSCSSNSTCSFTSCFLFFLEALTKRYYSCQVLYSSTERLL